jgi:hypothetical protein
MDIVKNNPDKEWNYDWLSINPNITWKIVQNNPDKEWNYDWISSNPNITWKIVNNNPDKKWNYDRLFENPNIASSIKLIDNISDTSIDYLSENMFLYHPYYVSSFYKKKLVKEFLDLCKEELISKVCSPKCILNWNEDVLLNKDNSLYGYIQKEIDLLF